ncbi:hypothetical protein DFH11DRAFT_1595338, partial [Phellopilus nigrolimitatus]
MVPQRYVPAGGDGGEMHAPAASQAPLESSTNIRTRKSRSSISVLGDYMLGKTLGAGSMGKVDLAYHDLTGEKNDPAHCVRSSRSTSSCGPTSQAQG